MKRRFAISLVATCILVSFSLDTDLNGQSDESEPDRDSARTLVLFDGSSLEHFRGYKTEPTGEGWKIDGQTLVYDGTGGGDIITKKKFKDFDLSFDWKVEPGANSGVMYRVTSGDAAPYFSGPEYQILDDSSHPDGRNDLTSAAGLYGLYKPVDKSLKPVGQWNSGKIVIRGNRVEHWLNGTTVVSAEIGSDDWNKRLNASKFKDWQKFAASQSGHIAFQDHGDKVWFRNIVIKSPE